jgi:hypothetical protein
MQAKLYHMTNDRYTRVVLTVIAAALVVDAGSKLFTIPVAQAAGGTMNCKIDDTVKIEGTIQIDTFSKPLSVKATETIPVRQEKY